MIMGHIINAPSETLWINRVRSKVSEVGGAEDDGA